ncbi:MULTISPECIES: hypothetical protein [unclassified Luteimonas]|jgi:hypothetical protein|uniref:hypothetical protein n=1 Tax=unclassified Luteimonas TaxID=2629088 RepID=UPI0011A93232|nr:MULTISPECIES: hypothetical protein [unclassified Luteimonas]
MMIRRVLLVIVLAAASGADAIACADPPKASFREIVASAPTIFTFQLTSAFYIHKALGDTAYTEYVVGHIKVIDPLKGDADSFKMIQYRFRSCGATRMSVGQTYLAATSQTGPLLQLWGMDQAILDLSRDFYHERTRRSPAVDIVKSIINGEPVPADFPREALLSPLDVHPVPAPPAPLK